MRNKTTFIALSLILFLAMPAAPQETPAKLKATAEESTSKDPISARNSYKKAYEAYVRKGNLDEAIRCGIKACDLYQKGYLYKESFDLLLNMEQAILAKDTNTVRIATRRYPIIKQRMLMYVAMKNRGKALDQLEKLEKTAKESTNDSITSDLLYTQAICYYNFGMMQQGDNALQTLTNQAGNKTNYEQVRNCYEALINVGRKANSARMVARTYESYINWNDSVNALQANQKYAKLNKLYNQSIAESKNKDNTISKKQALIITLVILLIILAAVIALGTLALLRLILLLRKQKKATATIQKSIAATKTQFIKQVTSKMQPALQNLDPTLPATKALTTFLQHIQKMAELEETADEHFETKEINIATFCTNITNKLRPYLKTDVTIHVNAPKLSTPVNEEHLEALLFHLLYNASRHTPAGGKITLEFHKRSAHTIHFLVSDTGDGIPEEHSADLFKPFARKKSIMQSDGLGLPICALLAKKMNGSLSLDTTYTKGARFLLELHV